MFAQSSRSPSSMPVFDENPHGAPCCICHKLAHSAWSYRYGADGRIIWLGRGRELTPGVPLDYDHKKERDNYAWNKLLSSSPVPSRTSTDSLTSG